MTDRIGVVVRVADPASGGNLALSNDVYLDPQALGARNAFDVPHQTLVKALGLPPMTALYLRCPVFTVGELLVLDDNERDTMGRKPSKWDVGVEWFDSLDDAVRRAREVAS